MTEHKGRSRQVRRHTVRPRWVWIALLLLIVGLVLIGVGIVVGSWGWAAPGLVALVLGGGLGIYGGLFYDVQGGSPSHAVRDVVEGNEHEFPSAGTLRHEDEVKRDVRRRWLKDR